MFPKKGLSRFGTLQVKDSPMNYHMLAEEDPADLNEDVTGDSGMGTSSGCAPYDSVVTWRQGVNDSPPDSIYCMKFKCKLCGCVNMD